MRWTMATLFLMGCSSGGTSLDGGVRDLGPDAARPRYRYVTNQILLPQSKTDLAADVDGDGRAENQLGYILELAAGALKHNFQTDQNVAVQNGTGLSLLSLASSDATLTDDADLQVNVYGATVTNPPDFSGNGIFSIDRVVPSTEAHGPLANHRFASADPLALADPPTVYATVVISDGNPATIPISGARMKFTASTTTLLEGQLSGAIKASDADAILIPAIARMLDGIAHRTPCDLNCQTVKARFDRSPADGTVSADEVRDDALIMLLFTPDVDLFDALGRWAPDPAKKNKDSISCGVGFTAVRANFTE